MISWIADNATLLYLLLGTVTIALALRWRTTRQGKYLIGLGVVVGLIGLVVVLSLTIVTARQQLVRAVEETARQLNAKNFEGAFRNFADEVRLEMSGQSEMVPRARLEKFARDNIQNRKISEIEVSAIDVESLDGAKAVVTFMVRAKMSDFSGHARCTAECVPVGEQGWRVRALKLELPLNAQVPFPR